MCGIVGLVGQVDRARISNTLERFRTWGPEGDYPDVIRFRSSIARFCTCVYVS